MKYVVLSFDDGLLDFYLNAFPILKKYNVLATVNIITGYSDKTNGDGFEYMNFEMIRILNDEGFEIASHGNSHLKVTNKDDFEIARSKIEQKLDLRDFGAALPFSQSIGNDLFEYFKKTHGYLCDYDKENFKKPLLIRIKYRFDRFFKLRHNLFYCNNFKYIYNKDRLLNSYPTFRRLPIKRGVQPEFYLYLIKKMKKQHSVTLMFHSILNKYSDNCPWPEGAWDVNTFEKFVSDLVKIKGIKVVTSKQLIRECYE